MRESWRGGVTIPGRVGWGWAGGSHTQVTRNPNLENLEVDSLLNEFAECTDDTEVIPRLGITFSVPTWLYFFLILMIPSIDKRSVAEHSRAEQKNFMAKWVSSVSTVRKCAR